MPDGFTFALDDQALLEALRAVGDAAQPRLDAAAKESADAIAREASARLQRQLGSARTPTRSRPDLGHGLTAAGLRVIRANTDGYLVVDERDPYPRLPVWVEKGTRRQAPRPFFYVSALLEEQTHRRRIEEALRQTFVATGLGE